MICPLCPEPLDQTPLTDWHGIPAHADCAARADADERQLLTEVEAFIASEHARVLALGHRPRRRR